MGVGVAQPCPAIGRATPRTDCNERIVGLPGLDALDPRRCPGQDEFESIPANARIEQCVPHSEVLKQAALSVNHAGHGIVSKSLYCGVPMPLVPMGRDQPGAAARAASLGFASVAHRDHLPEDAKRSAISEVPQNPKYMDNSRSYDEQLQARNSVADACALIEEIQRAMPTCGKKLETVDRL